VLAKYFIYWRPVEGQANITLDDATIAATGELAIQGVLGITLDNVTLLAAGVLGVAPVPHRGHPRITGGYFATGVIYLDDDEDVLALYHEGTLWTP